MYILAKDAERPATRSTRDWRKIVADFEQGGVAAVDFRGDEASDAVALAAAAAAFVPLGSDPNNALARDTENGLVDFRAPHGL
ncbi:MAG: hypothetical protein OXI87_07085 [Albidovulum sp.]|nr:hypothetical protein [Albidovulum sp.]MDE0530376.1 hypothetical protein [Albidovulum sp.]